MFQKFFPKYEVDGIYGPETEGAVTTFQEHNSITEQRSALWMGTILI
ncbi:peptidoglycan-binding protein [Geomicrobium halophilum]